MNLYTEISFPDYPVQLGYKSKSVFLGSCFAENIGSWLEGLKFPVTVNPFGISYNPISIAAQINRAIENKNFERDSFIENNGIYVNDELHSSLASADRSEAEENANKQVQILKNELKTCTVLFLTFGTSLAFERKDSGMIVNNCHKLPASLFERRMLGEEDMFNALLEALQPVTKRNPGVEIITSVSPVRHLRHGATINNRSKARLIKLCELLEDRLANCRYLPIYELVMDELRDYRFYRSDDFLHLNDLGLNVVKDRFALSMIHPKAYPIMQKVEKWQKMKSHIVLQPESSSAKEFAQRLQDLGKEIEILVSKQT